MGWPGKLQLMSCIILNETCSLISRTRPQRNRYVICVIKWIIGISRTSIDRPMLTIPDGLGHCLAQSKVQSVVTHYFRLLVIFLFICVLSIDLISVLVS